MIASKLLSPCHRVACCGGPARVWCSRCGTAYQADDPRLVRRDTPLATSR